MKNLRVSNKAGFWPFALLGAAFCVAVLPLGQAEAEQDKTFKVGDKVEHYYAAHWYPGTVVGVAKTWRGKTCFMFRHDDPGYKNDVCLFPEDIRQHGQALKTEPTLKAEDTFGTWGLAGFARHTSEGSGQQYAHHYAGTGGTLTISADRRYEWVLGENEVIRGTWELNPRPERYAGPVILKNGWLGHDWWVQYDGKTETGQHSVYVKSDIGTRYWGYKR